MTFHNNNNNNNNDNNNNNQDIESYKVVHVAQLIAFDEIVIKYSTKESTHQSLSCLPKSISIKSEIFR